MKYIWIAICSISLMGCSSLPASQNATQAKKEVQCIKAPCKKPNELARFIVRTSEGTNNEATSKIREDVKQYLAKQPDVAILPDKTALFISIETTPNKAKTLQHPHILSVEEDHLFTATESTTK